MLFKFRIISDESKEFARELLINSTHTFLDFHNCLQEELEYDPKQLASFFLTNEAWEKKLQITLIDMMDEESDNVIIMERAALGDYIKEEGQRMLYVFDFFSERSFFIELTAILKLTKEKSKPSVIFSTGKPPAQINLGLDNLSFTESYPEDDPGFESFDDDLSDEFDSIDSDDFPDD